LARRVGFGLMLAMAAAGALLVVSQLVGCEHQAAAPRPVVPGSGPPAILFSSGNQGVLAACGCPSNPSGGLAKRQAMIEQYRRTRSGLVVVDAGDTLVDRPGAIKIKYVAMTLGRGGYDALGLGDQELGLGVPELQRLAREYKLPYICSNVRDGAGQFIFPPHVIRQVGGIRVGIFAVVADEAFGFPPQEWRKGLKVEPPLEAAKREVAELRPACDLIVALSHQRLMDTRELAAGAAGIDVVVSGHDERMLPKGEKMGEALLVAAGDEGRLLGAITMTRQPKGPPQLSLLMTELSAQVPDASWVTDLYWQYVKEAKDQPPPDWKDTPVPPAYESAEACGKCHQPEYDQWLTTRHAHAYASIKRSGRQDDPECILCHTIGYGRKGGFVSMAETPDLGRVTCQACHAVTSEHGPAAALKGAPKDPKLDPMININSRLCMSCHGPIQSPDFDYYVYKPQILHKPPKDEKK
jgi:hypothetical protein